jgi:ketosteroid isomerase-like protein
MRAEFGLLVVLSLVGNATVSFSKPPSPEAARVTATLEAFHSALARGDAKAAMNLLAADAVILEGGSVETRAEYEAHHLQEDIRFARTVRNIRSDVRVAVEGNTAWLTSQSRAEGSFEGKQVSSSGVELAVLTKTSNGWRIRPIHWSSHKAGT